MQGMWWPFIETLTLFRVMQGKAVGQALTRLCLTCHRQYFGDSRQPFAITLLGTKLYILTNPRDISEAYRNSSSLSFDIFVKHLIRTCGSSKHVVERLYQHPQPPSEHRKSLGKALHDFQVHQSSPGQNLENLSVAFVEYFEKSLVFADVTVNSQYNLKASGKVNTATLSLSKWCAEVVINASQRAYFGDFLFEADPNLAQTFVEFDTLSWQLLYHFPRLISRKMHAAKERLIDALTCYFEKPVEKRTGAAWVTQLIEKEMRELGLTDREMGTLMMLQYWGCVSHSRLTDIQIKGSNGYSINTNVHKACFWMLSYMLFEPGLVELIRAETAAAFINGSVDYCYLERSCPRLQGLWLEVLRLTVSSSSIRYITENITIGGKLLRSGNVLINSCRQLHFNESVFGKDVFQFNSRRFVDDPNLHRSPSWKPFGGGLSLCPGQFIARRATCMFVAIILHRFDLELAFPQPFPQAEQNKPDLGVFLAEDDLVLNISQRSSGSDCHVL